LRFEKRGVERGACCALFLPPPPCPLNNNNNVMRGAPQKIYTGT